MAAADASSPKSPSHKRFKMSSTSNSDGEGSPLPVDAVDESGKPTRRRYKRRKVAIILGYCGFGFQGMQKNPGAVTIEGELEEAFFRAGAVPEADRGCPRRYDWARAARTDKGVSAAAQVVSGRFYVDPDGFVQRMNEQLSPQLKVFGFVRVTNSFSAKKFCDRRRYLYLLPVFALDDRVHCDREAVAASAASGKVLSKCMECSERGRKIPGVMGRKERSDLADGEVAEGGNTDGSVIGCVMTNGKDHDFAGSGGDAVGKAGASEQGHLCNEQENCLKAEETVCAGDAENMAVEAANCEGTEDKSVKLESIGVEEMKAEKSIGVEVKTEIDVKERKDEFTYSEEVKERFNKVLQHYVGTHNFHNFTTRTKAEDPSAKRYIISFCADHVVNIDGIDFVRCEVVGQSFMLHQIRKMIGLAVAVMRNCAPESLIDMAFRMDVNINVPTAPEVGLFLDECMFTSYNQKWKDTHQPVSIEPYAAEIEEFRMKYIFAHIASMEHKEGAVALWLHSLNIRNYPDFNFMEKQLQKDPGSGDGDVQSVVEVEVKEQANGIYPDFNFVEKQLEKDPGTGDGDVQSVVEVAVREEQGNEGNSE